MSTNSLLEGKHMERRKHHSINDFTEDLEENAETILKFIYKKIMTILFWMFLPISCPMILTRMFISDLLEVRTFCKKSLECAIVFLDILIQILEFFRDSEMSIEKKLERISKLVQTIKAVFLLPLRGAEELGKLIRGLLGRKKKAVLVYMKSYPPLAFSNLNIDDVHHLELSPSDCEASDDEDSGLSSIYQDGVSGGTPVMKSNKDTNSSPVPTNENLNSDKTAATPSGSVPKTDDVQRESNSQFVIKGQKPTFNERMNANDERGKTAKNERTVVSNEYSVKSETAEL